MIISLHSRNQARNGRCNVLVVFYNVMGTLNKFKHDMI